ncbi:MAG: MFS transporter [Pseudomonadota bacterium]
MAESAVLGRTQLNLRILSVVIFTFFCYLSVGLPLAVLPGFVHHNLGYSSFIAGIIISLQYFSTLISRPQSGRLADSIGPKKVVMLGLVLCGMSGVMTIIAAIVAGRPMLSLVLLAAGRICLGFGESFSSTGATLWGMNLVGPVHTARVISWNGVATYLAMAIGAPLGVLLDQGMGISGFAGLVAFMGGLGFVLASKKPAIIVTVAKRVPFRQVFRRVWIFGLGLSAGTIGFGVIATFITLYFSSRGWGGAAVTLTLYSLGFTVIRLVSGNAINRFGGLKVSLISFLAEGIGLFLLWHADSVLSADIGAFLTGCGFSLIFPALGVEAVKQVEPQSQGSALGTYSAFLDFGLGITGPVAGLLMNFAGIRSVYLAAMLVVAGGGVLMIQLLRRNTLKPV